MKNYIKMNGEAIRTILVAIMTASVIILSTISMSDTIAKNKQMKEVNTEIREQLDKSKDLQLKREKLYQELREAYLETQNENIN